MEGSLPELTRMLRGVLARLISRMCKLSHEGVLEKKDFIQGCYTSYGGFRK